METLITELPSASAGCPQASRGASDRRRVSVTDGALVSLPPKLPTDCHMLN